ncbi:putative DNA-directed RNA polymerase I subunit RPA2 [Frankliniella fusca]|uniref:DNA-directed RNA polymerase I subunit RPA2 n=1 Tax=Frankliniella fusca TaxID=407009 RepID=A0AAE1GZ52_9NEOP|nr:putative DNA-directed RNA polymerase I subunit RPA2 [Frankliniella fusca]
MFKLKIEHLNRVSDQTSYKKTFRVVVTDGQLMDLRRARSIPNFTCLMVSLIGPLKRLEKDQAYQTLALTLEMAMRYVRACAFSDVTELLPDRLGSPFYECEVGQRTVGQPDSAYSGQTVWLLAANQQPTIR